MENIKNFQFVKNDEVSEKQKNVRVVFLDMPVTNELLTYSSQILFNDKNIKIS